MILWSQCYRADACATKYEFVVVNEGHLSSYLYSGCCRMPCRHQSLCVTLQFGHFGFQHAHIIDEILRENQCQIMFKWCDLKLLTFIRQIHSSR